MARRCGAGDLLFTLDQRPFRIAVESARAEVARAEARLTLAEQQIQRYTPLAQQRIAPESELDTRRSALREAQAGLARPAPRCAKRNSTWISPRSAPRPGPRHDRRGDAGNLVQQGQTPDATLLALDPVYAVFRTPARRKHLRCARGPRRAGAPGRGRGRRLRAAPAARRGGGSPTRGGLDFVDSAFDPRSGTIRNRAVVPTRPVPDARQLSPGCASRPATPRR
jgi:multidrug efflux pump subunit AcrA (membrane-fusion protein)